MANYAVDDHVTSADSVEAVMAALEVIIDGGIDTGKVIRYIDIIPQPDKKWKGVIIIDA